MQWKVPLADVDLGEEEIDAVERVLRSRWLTMGEVTREFERAFAAHVGARHAIAVSNGTAALHLAYTALGLGPGDEVILPSLTFVATANTVLQAGARPVFADITSLDDLTISPKSIEASITPRTKAICVMHYAGYPCDMDKIMHIARRHALAVVEDAAHAPGAELEGRKCGAIGDIGCFSFFSNKNMAVGEGGMITTHRDDLAVKMRLMRSHGMTTLTWDRHRGHAHSYDVVALGYNYRLDEVHAAIGLVQLEKLAANNQRRGEVAAQYRRHLEAGPALKLPFEAPRGKASFHLFPVILGPGIDRAAFMEKMKAVGIQTSIHYPPIHRFSYYRERFEGREGELPLTEDVGRREVTLPLYPTMSDEQVQWVIDAVREARGESWRAGC
jgi:dTDP-4-amino-4,6-dideoxygalactose transaminase